MTISKRTLRTEGMSTDGKLELTRPFGALLNRYVIFPTLYGKDYYEKVLHDVYLKYKKFNPSYNLSVEEYGPVVFTLFDSGFRTLPVFRYYRRPICIEDYIILQARKLWGKDVQIKFIDEQTNSLALILPSRINVDDLLSLVREHPLWKNEISHTPIGVRRIQYIKH